MGSTVTCPRQLTCTLLLGLVVWLCPKARYRGLTRFRALLAPFLQIPPLIDPHFQEPLIGSNHRFFEALSVPAGCPAHGELHWCRGRSSGSQSGRHVLGLFFAGVTQDHQKLITTDPDDRFFRPDVAHEKASHLHQNAVPLGMTVGVVVLLEMI